MNQIFAHLLEWIKEAGTIALDKRKSTLAITHKTSRDLVTDADMAVDHFLRAAILKKFPDHTILSEELAPEQTPAIQEGALWIIDPIDGTHNYARQHYQSAVSIAYAEDGLVQCGAVYNPFLNELFSAERGSGAFLNDTPIHCSDVIRLDAALVGVGRPFKKEDTATFARDIENVLNNCFDLRRLGSGALDICWVACGRLDAFFETLNPWDIAAAVLIAKEAGASASAFRPRSDTPLPEELNGEHLLVAAPGIYEEMKDLLNSPTTGA